jgi:aminomethyltransferase
MDDLRRTPLHSAHRARGAKMVPFGGWEMPVEYSGLIAEHLAVRRKAGLFDVSHMGQFEIEGAGALAFLQRVTANDVGKLVPGQAQYSALPNARGCPIDDVIVYRRGESRFLMVVNAAVLRELTPVDLASIGSYHFVEGEVAGHPTIVARTGYTGEDGFELFVAPEAAEALWTSLLESGAGKGLVPAGLGARDTLRLEARMLLYGNDIDETTTLVEAGLGWVVALGEAKGEFEGRAVLAEQKARGAPRRLVGFEVVGRGIARHGYPVFLGEEPTGAVTSGSYAPFLQKNIGLCYLPTARATPGTEFDVEVRERRVAARVVPTPFYRRPR